MKKLKSDVTETKMTLKCKSSNSKRENTTRKRKQQVGENDDLMENIENSDTMDHFNDYSVNSKDLDDDEEETEDEDEGQFSNSLAVLYSFGGLIPFLKQHSEMENEILKCYGPVVTKVLFTLFFTLKNMNFNDGKFQT